MPNTIGVWGDVFDTTIIGIHQVLLPDGRVLYWGGDGNGNAFSNTQKYGIYDPVTGQHEILEADHVVRMFCGAGVIIPGTDQVLIGGGNGSGTANGQIFDLSDLELINDQFNQMDGGRFYPTMVSLSSGQLVIMGGNGSTRSTPEIFTLGEGWRTLDGATDEDLGGAWWYPRAWVNQDGNIMYFAINDGNQTGNITQASTIDIMVLDPNGDGSISKIGTVPFDMDVASPAVMYEVGKVVLMDAYGDLWYMDMNGPVPEFTFAYDFENDRNNSDMTVLPDGRILINGGTTVGNSQDEANAVFQSVIFNPFSGEVTFVDSEDVMRLYHSSTLLLADGTILSMGGGGLNGTLDFMDAQIYQPDYLFNDDGTLADRPEITLAPEVLLPGETFVISVDDASSIARMSFVKTGAVTHSINMEAGRMDLAFTVLSNTQIQITLPDNPNIVGAGNWMLFAIDDNGVPSVAPIISVQPTLPLYTLSGGEPGLLAEYFTIASSTTTLDNIDFDADPISTQFVDHIDENGIFYQGGPADDFAVRYTGEFNVDQSGTYTFYLTSDDGSRLFVDGQLVVDNDGLHAATLREVSVDLSAGVHTIEVRYFERGGGSVLDLDWAGPGFDRQQMTFPKLSQDDRFEENETFDTAADLGVITNATFNDLEISSDSDFDYFKFTAGESGLMNLSAVFSHGEGDLDVEVFDSSGNRIVLSESVTDNELASFNVVSGESYVVLVFGYDGSTNEYELQFEVSESEPYEPNNTFDTAADLGVITNASFNDLDISSDSDLDYFKFTAGETGQINLTALFSHSSGDIDMEVYDISGNRISLSESVTDNEVSSLNVVAGESYVVLVFGYDGATNNYALQFESSAGDLFEPNNTFDTAADIGVVTSADYNNLSISSADDPDYIRFTAGETGEFNLSVLFEHDKGDIDVEILDDNGNRIALAESISDNEFISFDVDDGVSYVARIFGYDGATNNYDLIVNIVASGPSGPTGRVGSIVSSKSKDKKTDPLDLINTNTVDGSLTSSRVHQEESLDTDSLFDVGVVTDNAMDAAVFLIETESKQLEWFADDYFSPLVSSFNFHESWEVF